MRGLPVIAMVVVMALTYGMPKGVTWASPDATALENSIIIKSEEQQIGVAEAVAVSKYKTCCSKEKSAAKTSASHCSTDCPAALSSMSIEFIANPPEHWTTRIDIPDRIAHSFLLRPPIA